MNSDLKWAMNLKTDRLFSILERGTEEQKRTLINHIEQRRHEPQQDIASSQTRLSLEQYKARLTEKLPNATIKEYLKASECLKLYRLFYGDTTKIDAYVDDSDDDDIAIVDKEWDNGSFDHKTSKEEYYDTFISLLQKINSSDRNSDRLKFHTFFDVCWRAVNFDVISIGNLEIVYNQETCSDSKEYLNSNRIRPNKLRGYCLDHIKAFFFAEMEAEENMDQTRKASIEEQFKGICKIVMRCFNLSLIIAF